MTTTFRPIPLSKFEKRFRRAGSKPAVGSSTMINFGFASWACAIQTAASFPPNTLQGFFPAIPQIGLLKQPLDNFLSLEGGADHGRGDIHCVQLQL